MAGRTGTRGGPSWRSDPPFRLWPASCSRRVESPLGHGRLGRGARRRRLREREDARRSAAARWPSMRPASARGACTDQGPAVADPTFDGRPGDAERSARRWPDARPARGAPRGRCPRARRGAPGRRRALLRGRWRHCAQSTSARGAEHAEYGLRALEIALAAVESAQLRTGPSVALAPEPLYAPPRRSARGTVRAGGGGRRAVPYCPWCAATREEAGRVLPRRIARPGQALRILGYPTSATSASASGTEWPPMPGLADSGSDAARALPRPAGRGPGRCDALLGRFGLCPLRRDPRAVGLHARTPPYIPADVALT